MAIKLGKILCVCIAVLSVCTNESTNSKETSNRKFYEKKKVFLPLKYAYKSAKVKLFASNDFSIKIYAKNFSLGNAAYIEIKPAQNISIKNIKIIYFSFNKRYFPLVRKKWGYRGLFAIHPEGAGRKRILIIYKQKNIRKRKIFYLHIKSVRFPYYRSLLNVGKFSNSNYYKKHIAFIRQCTKKKNIAFSSKSPDYLDELRSHPRNRHMVTSPYWSKRKYLRYKIQRGRRVPLKSKIHIHQGLDLYGKKGDPVYSLMSGKVVLAEKLFFEGNFIVIDHGNKIFTYFMHLHSISISKGDMVQAGDLIGTVGSTGVSTAAHLHISLVIRGIQVHPLSVLSLPIRN